MPAANDDFAAFSSKEEHLLKGHVLDKVRDDTKGVHAHAGKSEGLFAPKIMLFLEHHIFADFSKLNCVTLLEINFLALHFEEVRMEFEG